MPAKAAVDKFVAGWQKDEVTLDDYLSVLQALYAMFEEQSPQAESGQNPADHFIVLQTMGLQPRVLAGFLAIDDFVKAIPEDRGDYPDFNRAYSVDASQVLGLSPKELGDPQTAVLEKLRMRWATVQTEFFQGSRAGAVKALDGLVEWFSVGSDGQPWVSQSLVIAPLTDAANALRSEVRSVKAFILTLGAIAAFSLPAASSAVGKDKVPQAIPVVEGVERVDEDSPISPEFTPEKRQLERAKEIFKLAQKRKIDQVTVDVEGLGKAVIGFSEDDGLEPLLQKSASE
jgi:hypothetical protein